MKRNATAIIQNPYIDLVDTDDDEEDDNQPDVRIFQAPPGYPFYLQAKDKVKARNGYVFTQFDKERKKNISNCSYERPLPTRGNCVMCGRSGPLGNPAQMGAHTRDGRQRASTALPRRGSTRTTQISLC